MRIPQLEIRVDYARAALYAVQPAAMVEQLSRLSNGRAVSRVVDGYRRFDVTMRLPDHLRTTQRLGDLLIETPSGWIPARQIAEINETEGPNQIVRENSRRRIVVLANAAGGADMAEIVARIRVTAGEKLHRLAGAKLHHGGVGGSWGGICGTDGGCARSRERSSPEAAQRRALGAGLDGESAHRAIIREPRCALVYGRERTTSRYGASVFRRLIG